LPPLYSTESEDDPIVYIKFFTPDSNWTWYILEGSIQEDGNWLFFAYVCGMFNEYGYVLLNELEEARGPMGMKIERDIYFEKRRMSEIREEEKTE